MEIRPAKDQDISRIAATYAFNQRIAYKNLLSDEYLASLTEDRVIQKWKTYLNQADSQIFVAYEEDTFLGFAASCKDTQLDQCWYLDSLHVTEQARGKGVGTRLLHAVGAYARSKGFAQMSICIVKGNDRAKALYEKLGAEHYIDFIDDFGGTPSHSEKLIWKNLDGFGE